MFFKFVGHFVPRWVRKGGVVFSGDGKELPKKPSQFGTVGCWKQQKEQEATQMGSDEHTRVENKTNRQVGVSFGALGRPVLLLLRAVDAHSM